MSIYLKLFYTFFKIGLFTFGGGYAMLPMLEREIVTNNKWATSQQLMDYFAIGQCTPGVIAVNTATFIGYSLKKIPGAIVATLGVVCPSLIIILLIATLLSNFADIPLVQYALSGIRAAVCVLIAKAVLKLFKGSVFNIFTVLVFVVAFILSESGVPIILVVVLAAIAGLVMRSLEGSKKEGEENG